MNLLRSMVMSVCIAATLAGCTGAPPSNDSGDRTTTVTYDPLSDPLVNPEEMFEPFPADDLARVDFDATLVRHSAGEPRNLNPILVNSWFDFYMQTLLFSYIYRRDETLTWKPSAERVEWVKDSEDRMTTTVKLRPGQIFHDGHPLSTEDIKFTWQASGPGGRWA